MAEYQGVQRSIANPFLLRFCSKRSTSSRDPHPRPLRTHAVFYIAAIVNKDKQRVVAEFPAAFLPLPGGIEGLASARVRQPFPEKELDDNACRCFSRWRKFWRDRKLAVNLDKPARVQGVAEIPHGRPNYVDTL
jgi:hypothetical protein